MQWLQRRSDPGWGTRAEDFRPEALCRILAVLARVFEPGRMLAVDVEGWANLPDAPTLLVSNHSGGSSTLDAWGFGYAWYRHFGVQRPLHIMAHEILLSTRLTGPLMSRIGVLRASNSRAREVLGEWSRDLWVMPGGDRDTWRPWVDRYRTRFAGHRGYARLALSTGIRATPVAHAGPHDTLLVLTDGRAIARRLRLHELARIDVFPVHLSLPWGLGIGPLPHLPWPRPLHYRIGPPVPFPPGYQVGDPIDDDLVRTYDRAVIAGVQRLLDELRARALDR